MTEPRMRVRQKGQQFATADLEAFLHAFGSTSTSPHQTSHLPETIRALDEIVTDFIIETCHNAAVCATYSHRAKIKVDDFKFALRRDPKKLGRVTELLSLEREIKRKRKAFEVDEGVVAKGEGGFVEEVVEGGGKGKARGKRRRKSGGGGAGGDGEADDKD